MAIDVRHLNTAPRAIDLICLTDGSTRTLLDDGGAIIDGRFKPNGRRILLYRTCDKRDRDGRRLFYAAEPIKAAFKGDPLADVPTLDDEAKARMATLIAARALRAEEAEAVADVEKRKSRKAAARKKKAAEASANE